MNLDADNSAEVRTDHRPKPSLNSSDVRELPVIRESVVAPAHIDDNGHMNVRHYLALAADAIESWLLEIGMGPPYIASRGLTTFTAEHHLTYMSELRLGAQVTAHHELMGRAGKAMHTMTYLVDTSRDVVACTLETIIVHVSIASRRPTPFPPDMAERLDLLVSAPDTRGWCPPLNGAMGLRKA